jgi:hypothetical protein
MSEECKAACARKAKPRATQAACTIYTVLHTLIDVHQSYVPFWLLGVVGADLRPDKELALTTDDAALEQDLVMVTGGVPESCESLRYRPRNGPAGRLLLNRCPSSGVST